MWSFEKARLRIQGEAKVLLTVGKHDMTRVEFAGNGSRERSRRPGFRDLKRRQLPSFVWYADSHDSLPREIGAKKSKLARKPHGNACYTGYVSSTTSVDNLTERSYVAIYDQQEDRCTKYKKTWRQLHFPRHVSDFSDVFFYRPSAQCLWTACQRIEEQDPVKLQNTRPLICIWIACTVVCFVLQTIPLQEGYCLIFSKLVRN